MRLALVVGLLGLSGCVAAVAVPDEALHGGDGFVAVPYPPPVARVEQLPPRPSARAVWLDGSWEWTGSGYEWQRGRWAEPPPGGTRHASGGIVRSPTGALYYYPTRWYRADGQPLTPVNP
ncbi:MAG: hypothetical protein FJ096_00275 [Deltaproteobacteria bacterium]|nr:hypothetical protein [Deltaproteobacteria bacterium]